MNHAAAHDEHLIHPFALIGLNHSFLTVNTSIILYTWLVLGILTILLVAMRISLSKKGSVAHYMSTMAVEKLIDIMTSNIGYFSYKQALFIASLFTFLFLCNIASIIPYVEEPTQDINTALALGIISFLYTQFHAIKAHGLWAYIKEYFSPLFIMFPINVIGELAKIISISFRLYGNMFGGAIISSIYFGAIKNSIIFELIGIITGLSIIIKLFFGFFEGAIQALVFTMLSLTYLSLAITHKE